MLRQMWTRSSACMMRSGSRLGPAFPLSSLVKQQRTMCGVQPTRSFSYLSKLGRGSEKDKDRGGGKRRGWPYFLAMSFFSTTSVAAFYGESRTDLFGRFRSSSSGRHYAGSLAEELFDERKINLSTFPRDEEEEAGVAVVCANRPIEDRHFFSVLREREELFLRESSITSHSSAGMNNANNDVVKDKAAQRRKVKRGKVVLMGVLDGHGGWQASNYTAKIIGPLIEEAIVTRENRNIERMKREAEKRRGACSRRSGGRQGGRNKKDSFSFLLSEQEMEEALKEAFQKCDERVMEHLYSAFVMGFPGAFKVGACASAVVQYDDRIYFANAGDSRAVAASKQNDGVKVVLKTYDHSANDKAEQERIKQAHPGEANYVVAKAGGTAHYVKGKLMPTRGFGDSVLKDERFHPPPPTLDMGERHTESADGSFLTSARHLFGRKVSHGYTPPYTSSEPDVYSVKKQDVDVIIVASDGLWDDVESEEAADIALKPLAVENVPFWLPERCDDHLSDAPSLFRRRDDAGEEGLPPHLQFAFNMEKGHEKEGSDGRGDSQALAYRKPWRGGVIVGEEERKKEKEREVTRVEKDGTLKKGVYSEEIAARLVERALLNAIADVPPPQQGRGFNDPLHRLFFDDEARRRGYFDDITVIAYFPE
mmetsp:Transcript_12405/g.33212  ORF Transcript_12405/g.33212 Transcript_12405/m.33212 type:complete len:650 (-) Transcript_12405:118-2067(-)